MPHRSCPPGAEGLVGSWPEEQQLSWVASAGLGTLRKLWAQSGALTQNEVETGGLSPWGQHQWFWVAQAQEEGEQSQDPSLSSLGNRSNAPGALG